MKQTLFRSVSIGFLLSINLAWADKVSLPEPKELKSKLQVHEVTLKDPIYLKVKTYEAFLLKDFLNQIKTDSAWYDEILFHCVDGYAPSVEKTKLESQKVYLAFKEKGKPDSSPWEKQTRNGKTFDFSPYYLIWEKGEKYASPEKGFHWPYQLVAIELIDFQKKYDKIYPEVEVRTNIDRKGVLNGFQVFKNQCLKCHALNGQGGDMGPELNFPKNITEYWVPSEILKYIQNPSGFRTPNKMPSVVLSSQDSKDLLKYLKVMKKWKISPKP